MVGVQSASFFTSSDFKAIILSIITAAIIGIFSFLWKKRKSLRIIRNIQLFINISKSGMTNFYFNKNMLRKQMGTIGDEIKQAKKKFIYIGYTMSDILNQDFEEAIIDSIEKKGVCFEFCILDNASESSKLYASYTRRDQKQTDASVTQIYVTIERIKRQLKDANKEKIKLYFHNMFVPSSCFLVDMDEPSGWLHFNYKAPRSIKLRDFGFIINVNDNNDFSKNMKKSYTEILDEIYNYNERIRSSSCGASLQERSGSTD